MADPIQSDTPCIACGYSLRGIVDDAKCPECGMLAVKSRSGRPLAGVSSRALRWMRIGAWLMVTGMLAVFALAMVSHFAFSWESPGFSENPILGRRAMIFGLSSKACVVLAAFGMGMFLWAKLPKHVTARTLLRPAGLSHVSRLLVLLFLTAELLSLVVNIRDGLRMWRFGYRTLWWGEWLTFPWTAYSATILRTFVLGLVCLRIRRFALLRGNRALARWSCAAWVLPLAYAVWWSSVLTVRVNPFHTGPQMVWDCCGAIFAIVVVFAAREISRELRLR